MYKEIKIRINLSIKNILYEQYMTICVCICLSIINKIDKKKC